MEATLVISVYFTLIESLVQVDSDRRDVVHRDVNFYAKSIKSVVFAARSSVYPKWIC